MISNFITSLRPFGGKNLPSADFAFTSFDIDELYIKKILDKMKLMLYDENKLVRFTGVPLN